MKFKRYAKMKQGLQAFDLVPFVDVIIQVLLFYILVSAFTFSPNISVRLPKAVTSDDVEEKNTVITITSENLIYLGDKLVSFKDLKSRLAPVSKHNASILIKSDRRASVGRIVDVWNLCRMLGIERLNIATDGDQ